MYFLYESSNRSSQRYLNRNGDVRYAGGDGAGTGVELIVLLVVDEDKSQLTLQWSSNIRIGPLNDAAVRDQRQMADLAVRIFSDLNVEYGVVSEDTPLPTEEPSRSSRRTTLPHQREAQFYWENDLCRSGPIDPA